MQSIKEHLALMREIKSKIKNNDPSYDDLFQLQSVMNYMLEDACEIVDNKLDVDIAEYRKSARQIGDYIRFYANQRREYADDLWDELYWSVYKIEGRNRVLDSYLLFLERKREEKDRFYKPRRTCYMKIGLMDALQDILDDKLDILSISMPPGTGKLLADDTPVLTSIGWKSHGDLSVGDYVYGLDGRLKKVERVFPKDFADVLVTFSNGEKIQCHENHEWLIISPGGNCTIAETKQFQIAQKRNQLARFEIPYDKSITVHVRSVERVARKVGNCIQVEGGVYRVGTTSIPTHNSTVEKFFHAGLCGWFPADFNLFYSHSSDITRMYYDGVADILTNGSEYAWNEMFPELKVTGTNAKLEQLNIGAYKPFPNVQCTSVGSKNAGKVRASKFLLCDDLIGGIEEALNKNTLEKLWSIYSVDARQRKIDGCKEIHIATRWSVHDVIGRLQRMYDGSDRCRFIAVPDIDPETGFSNFQFDINPFSVAFFHDQEKLMDEVSYRCLYKNEPIEREGLLYTENNIRYYMALPEQTPDEILGQVDAKAKGTDFMFMPVLYRYGDDYYCVDCVCNKESDYEMQYRRLADTIVLHRMNNCEFESNMGGDRVGMEVSKRVQAKGWVCNITDRPTESNKEARIFQCSNWVQQHILFKSKEMYPRKCDYAEMMHQLLSYSVAGKNPNDDVPDCFANFALRVTGANKTATVEAAFNPFRRNFW